VQQAAKKPLRPLRNLSDFFAWTAFNLSSSTGTVYKRSFSQNGGVKGKDDGVRGGMVAFVLLGRLRQITKTLL
jgi:hypothetical protein